jgi:transposase
VAQHVSDEKTATGNMLRGLLAEFGLEIPRGDKALKREIPLILEDAENGLPLGVRESLDIAWQLWRQLDVQVKQLDKLLAQRAAAHEPCQRLMALAGVGPKNALGLYVTLGNGRHFKNGRNASACIGATPQQHSSGGRVRIGHISRQCGNKRLRANLITGAHAVIQVLEKRGPRTEKERWLAALIERRGKGRAAVALVNKTIRTAWAMLAHQEAYHATPGTV